MPAKDLKVVDRGSFFDDAFFRDSWEDFDKAMQNVLDRYDSGTVNVDSASRPKCHDLYRKIRSDKIGDDMYASQAVQVTEKDGRFQVVMDVRDFNPRDLQVRVVDERIKVEGRFDQVSEDGKSSTSKAFYKEFTLPVQANIDQLSTALSKDGILTIKAPKKEGMPLPEPPKAFNNASHLIQNALNERLQSSPSYESSDGVDSLPRDVRERLLISDKDSGRSSGSGSPIPSLYSTTSCASPAPSDGWSTTTEYDHGKRSPYPKSPFSPNPNSTQQTQGYGPVSPPPSYGPMSPQPPKGPMCPPPTHGPMMPPPNYGPTSPPPTYGPMNPPLPNYGPMTPPPAYGPMGPPPNYGPTSPTPLQGPMSPTYNYGPMQNMPNYGQPNTPEQFVPMAPSQTKVMPSSGSRNTSGVSAAVGSGGTATVSVRQDGGKRTLTQETTSVVQQKDGFLESKEVSAEVTDKDSQAARREAVTRMSRQEDDPEGRFKRSETADASDVNETCVKTMPDGSVMTVKKSSTSSSNFKQSYSTEAPTAMPDQGFPAGFADMRNMMGRSRSMMSQMSSDSMNSNTANFPDMPGMNRFPGMDAFQNMGGFGNTNQFPNMPGFPNRTGFSNQNMPQPGQRMQGNMQQPNYSNSNYSTSSSFSQSSTNNTFNSKKF